MRMILSLILIIFRSNIPTNPITHFPKVLRFTWNFFLPVILYVWLLKLNSIQWENSENWFWAITFDWSVLGTQGQRYTFMLFSPEIPHKATFVATGPIAIWPQIAIYGKYGHMEMEIWTTLPPHRQETHCTNHTTNPSYTPPVVHPKLLSCQKRWDLPPESGQVVSPFIQRQLFHHRKLLPENPAVEGSLRNICL